MVIRQRDEHYGDRIEVHYGRTLIFAPSFNQKIPGVVGGYAVPDCVDDVVLAADRHRQETSAKLTTGVNGLRPS